jgi:DNA-binding NtrC family response regulator
MNPRILIVDDDPNIIEVLDARLTASSFQVLKTCDAPSALDILKKHKVDLMISDMKMPAMGGMDLFSRVRSFLPELPVIFLTAYGTIPDAVDAVKAGAVDYITKPFNGKDLIKKINRIIGLDKGADPVGMEDDFYWGKSPVMKALYEKIKKVAPSQASVLILGESGVGKECIARFVHEFSPRRDQPYVVVDCGSTPVGILESELFGHLKGSFTHAVQDKTGLMEAADKGSLFLDEIGNISPEMQSRLLRFLEDKKIRRVGAIKEKSVDCRIISATNADLAADIEAGTFRQDLYYRLRVVPLHVPSLRERKEDIPELASFFADRYTRENKFSPIELPKETLDWLKNYPWPGNIRELKNSLEAGIILCRNNRLTPGDLQLEPVSGPLDTGTPFSIKESEKETIIRALKKSRGVQKRAAELLEISRRAIHYKIKKYGINASAYK